VRPNNSWDLKSYKQRSDETLREYIRRFSKQCSELPDIVDADVMAAFLSGTTCRSLVHKLGSVKPMSTKELLDITTNHASGEEAMGDVFVKDEVKKLSNKEVVATCCDKRKKNNKKRHGRVDDDNDDEEMVTPVGREGKCSA
jgi:ethanolamine ammonia-lyase small subunit